MVSIPSGQASAVTTVPLSNQKSSHSSQICMAQSNVERVRLICSAPCQDTVHCCYTVLYRRQVLLSIVVDRLAHVGMPHVPKAAAVAFWKLPRLELTLRCSLQSLYPQLQCSSELAR